MEYANHLGYSDINPFEVVRRVSDKCIEIRAMSAERDETWKPEILPGGFAGHCVNQHSQRWTIASDANGRTLRIRLSKRGLWKDKDGARYNLSDKPVKFYDYNF